MQRSCPMKKRWFISAVFIGISVIVLVSVGLIMSNVEMPNYEVVKSQCNIEIRKYRPMLIAEVRMGGKRKEVIGDGFRILADYIFGNNLARRDISMTAPVQQEKTTIAMTAPFQQQSKDDQWKISFVMPSKYTIDNLPKPVNEHITIKKIPAQTFVVIIFSGTNSDKNIKDHEKQLMEYVSSNELSVVSSPKYAFYNPPWTLPFMRRNEVMIEIREP